MAIGEGDGFIGEGPRLYTAEEALERVIGQLEGQIETAEKDVSPPDTLTSPKEARVKVLEGFPERVEREIIFCDADSINTGMFPLSNSFLMVPQLES